MSKKPVLLCIMDGFGWTPNETYGNAVAAANKPFIDSLLAKYPMTTIDASGMAVGLPDGQMGNSEVGHTNMGAGRIVYQQLTLITKSIRDGEMLKNPVLVKNMKAAIDAGKAIHLMGLVGTGGVHSHADHWFGVLEMAKHMGAKEVYLHCITDGRDTDPHSGKGFLADLQAKLDELGIGKIASVSGRYYAMDRDNNWDREEKAYAAFVYGEGNHAANAAEAIEASYAADVTDEFVIPVVTCEGGRVQDGDTVIFMNFRPARAHVGVADLRVAHLAVGQADSHAAGLDGGHGVIGKDLVQIRLVRGGHGVAVGLVRRPAEAVHDAEHNRFLRHKFVDSLIIGL